MKRESRSGARARVLALAALLVTCTAGAARAEWTAERWRECLAEGMRGGLFAPQAARGPVPGPPVAWRAAAFEARWRQPLERRGIVPPSPFGARGAEPLRVRGTLAPALGVDVRVHTREGSACAGCPSGLFSQVEPSVAMLGSRMVVSFNDRRSLCGGGFGRQGIGWSADGGITFRDTHGLPSGLPGLQNLSGDPSVAVNARTGVFYLAGFGSALGQLGFEGRLGIARGHFAPDSFVFDAGTVLLSPNNVDFYDKPFMTADSVSGNVYLAWTNISDAGPVIIMLQRYDANLVALGPPLEMNDPAAPASAQFPMPICGPGGELYLAWWEAAWDSFRSRILVRRSDDFGATFGPAVQVADYDGNIWNGAPGMLRRFGPVPIAAAIDRTNGPHRGRLYLSWDQSIPHLAFRTCDTTSVVDAEPNGDLDHAQPFVPGGWLRGVVNDTESDFYAVQLQGGQTVFMSELGDSLDNAVFARVWKPASPGAQPRLLANGEIYAGGVLFSAPSTGTYYVEIYGGLTGETHYYRVATKLLEPAPGDVARDVRDAVVAWSDDGQVWSVPRRIDDSAPGSDIAYTSVAVDGRGRVHAYWLDYREDPATGTYATPYAAASGDGGVTWGASRRMGDALSDFQNGACLSNGNSLGDYLHMAAEGDRVAAVFPDTRDGDQDIYVDVSSYALLAEVPPDTWQHESHDTTVTFTIVNRGTHTRALDWSIGAPEGWLAAAFPGLNGTANLAAGETLSVQAVVPPAACAGDSARLRLLVSDAAIPGALDSAVTVLHCVADSVVPVLVSLVSASARADRVDLVWFAPSYAGASGTVERSVDGVAWAARASLTVDGDGRASYGDDAVVPGTRYAYRLEFMLSPDGGYRTAPTWIDVPTGARFALAGTKPNPTSGPAVVSFSLPGAGAARLQVFDLLGRLVRTFDVGSLGAGEHVLPLDREGALAPGVYVVRLACAGETRRTRIVVTR